MSTGWKNVHVFISSTFNDMHGERDYLVKRVFPQLRESCERRKLRLVDIDLRWGVTEEDATRNKNVVRTCLKRIDDCRPFFVCFLGQRRGWAPKPDEVASETFDEFPSLKPHIGRASITELEILHALINPFHGQQHAGESYDPVKHAFFYLREPDYLDQMPATPVQLRETYTNAASADPAADDAMLQRWREQELPATTRPVNPYRAAWTPEATTPELALPLQCPSSDPKNIERWREAWKRAGVTVTGLDVEDNPAEAAKARNLNARLTQGRLTDFVADTGEALADMVLRELQAGIEERYPDYVPTEQEDPLQQELDQQAAFLAVSSEGFIERTGDFDALNTYLDDDSRQLFVLTAEGGMGKSMLLANWLDRRQEDMHRRDTALVYRFIGQSDASSTVPGLLRSMMLQLQDLGRIPKTKMATVEDPQDPNNKIEQEVPFDIPQDPTELHNTWQEQRRHLGEEGRAVVVIDALNQLESGMKHLYWLPFAGLPENVKVILSFRADAPDAGECIERWGNNPHIRMEQVKPFEELADRRNLVDAYLARFLKELDKDHLEALIQSEGAHNPLFLKVVLSELRVHGAFGQLGEKIKREFGTTPVSAFNAVLHRLETDPAYSALPPAQSVPLIFGLLAHARRGLSDDELTDLLLLEIGNSGPGKTGTGNGSAATEGSENGACTRFAQDKTEDGNERGAKEGSEDNTSTQVSITRQAIRDTVYLFLRQLRPFLARRNNRYDFFYESFKTAALERYVKDAPRATTAARTPQQWHGLISDYLNTRWQEPYQHALEDLPWHQIQAEQWHELIGDADTPGTLTDLLFIQAKCEAGLVYELMTDYNEALAALPEFREESAYLQQHDVAMRYYTQALRDYAVRRCDWLQQKEQGNILPEPDYPAMPEILEKTDGRKIPEEESERAARLRRFANFVSGHLKLLTDFPADTLPLAHNWAEGPVAERATNQIQETKLPCLKRLPRPHTRTLRPQCLHTLEGHAGVLSVCVSPDGRNAVSGSGDKTMHLWDLHTGQCLHTLEGHTGFVESVCVSPDGRRALSGSMDNTVRLWDLEAGQCLRTFEGHSSWVYSVCVSPDGRHAVSGSGDKTMRVWDLETGNCLHILQGHADRVYSVCVSPDGRRALSGSTDNTVRLWDLETGYCLRTLEGHTSDVTSVSVSPDGRRALSGSGDKTLRVWDLETGQCLRTLEGHTGSVRSVCVSPDGRRAVSGGTYPDKTVRLWDMETGQGLRTLEGHTSDVISVSVGPDGRRALSGSRDNTLRLWDLETGQGLRSLEGHSSWVNSVCVSPDGRHAVSGSGDKTLRVWDLETGQGLRSLEGHTSWVNSVCVSPDGRHAVSGSYDKTVRVWDLEMGQCLRTLEGHTSSVNSVRVSPEGRRAVSGSKDKTLRVWDLETGQCLRTLEGHTNVVISVCLSPDGRRALSAGGSDRTVRVWDLETGQCLRKLEGHTWVVHSVCMSPDGRRAVSGSEDHTLRVWDMETGQCLRTLEGHTSWVRSVYVNPNGRHAVSGSRDNTLRVWDLETGQCMHKLEGHTWAVYSVYISPDGRHAVSGSGDKTLRVWDLETGACLAVYHAGSGVNAVALRPAGDRIICVSGAGLHFLTPVNFPPSGPLVVSAVRLWHFGTGAQPGHWDDHRTVQCPWCGRRFPVRDDQLGHQITCPLEGCGGMMQLNAFVAGGLE